MPVRTLTSSKTGSQIGRLIMRLCYHADLLNQTVTNLSNYKDSADVVAKTILDLLEVFDIYCVPGNEWQRLEELRKQCRRIASLALIPTSEPDTIWAECIEAIQQYCYLLEFESISRAALIENLCLRGDDTWATTMTTS